MSPEVELPGTARLELAANVAHLEPESALFQAMLTGWERQQKSRFLNERGTIAPRLALVRRLADFTNTYPWQWEPADAEAFISHLRSSASGRPRAMSTIRAYETTLALFMDYVTDRRYGWAQACLERFGQVPQQIFHEHNRVAHTVAYEGRPGRRPLTYDEVQDLFDAADHRAEHARARGRKGALTAMRDAALLKTVYAFGLRRAEARGLDLADARHNPKMADYGRFGALFVRQGKAANGSPPRRRTVLCVPEMDWVVDVLEQWVEEIRPLLDPGKAPALWVSERRGRISLRSVNHAFEEARREADLDEALDLHSLRHSYVTHLVEFDYPERFVSEQVGHSYASTTAIYTGVSDAYRLRLLERSLKKQHAELWDGS